MDWKIFVKPAATILDTMLDGLIAQIKSGDVTKAVATIEQVRALLKALTQSLK